MATRSTDLKFNILGDYSSLKKALGKSTREVDRFGKGVDKSNKRTRTSFSAIGKSAIGAAAGIGAVAIAGNELKKSVTETVDLAKATRQLQRATGLASEDASQLAAVLKVRGVGTDKLGRSFTTLARQIEAAKTGTGAAAENFRKLGVSQDAIRKGNVRDILVQVADGYKRLGDGTTKAAAAQQLFGRNSRDLLPLLEGGSKKLREQLALAPQLSDAQVKQSLAMVNAQRQVDLALLNVRTTLGTTLLPILADGANKLAKFVTEMKTGKGAGGEFAKKAKEIFNAIKPAAEQLLKAAKAAFEFAANNPGLVKVLASLAAVGLAIKAIRFTSAITGLSTFVNTAKALGGPLKKLFSRFGTRAGTAFAGEAAAGMAGSEGLGGALAPGGRVGKMGKKDGKFDKWGRRMGKAAVFGFIAGFIALFGDELSRAISKKLGEMGLPKLLQDHFLGFFGTDAQAPTVDPNSKAYKDWERRQAPRRRGGTARGSSMRGFARGAARLRPSLGRPGFGLTDFGKDPFTGGIPLEVLLARAEGKSSRAQYNVDRFQAGIGDSRSKAETKRLKELTAAARTAKKEVEKLQRQLARRDALLEIRAQFKDFTQGFTDAYAQGLQNIAEARLNAAQTLAQKSLDSQLRALDEEQGNDEEARRIRELRAQQETEAKTREDEDYAKSKLAIETDLARAIRNGNLKGQQDLQDQLEQLEQQRRDLLRSREIADLSESLNRRRQAAQTEYDDRLQKAQDYYDAQLELNKQAVDAYKASIDEQMKALTDQLDAGKISYADFNTRVTELAGWLTGMLKGDLDNRATNELNALRDSTELYRGYVGDVNTVLDGIRKSIPVPEIPPIPTITVDAILNIQSINGLPSGITTGGGGSTPAPGPKRYYSGEVLRDLRKNYRGLTVSRSDLRQRYDMDATTLNRILQEREVKKAIKDYKIKITGRASGGRLSRAGLTMVGETGPELIAGGNVYSATKTARMNAAGGVTLNVYPQTTADDPVALARALGWQLATR